VAFENDKECTREIFKNGPSMPTCIPYQDKKVIEKLEQQRSAKDADYEEIYKGDTT